METDQIIGKLKDVLTPYSTNKEAIDNLTIDSDFIKDLNVNSAHLVDIVLEIENAFDIEIDNASMERMINVGESVNVIKEKLAEKSA